MDYWYFSLIHVLAYMETVVVIYIPRFHCYTFYSLIFNVAIQRETALMPIWIAASFFYQSWYSELTVCF